MKLPFKRNKNDSAVPADIQNYYQTERTQRSGVAWLLALGTLLVTVGLVLGLFFGGRFIYRTITDNDKPAEISQTESNDGEVAAPGSDSAVTTTPNTPAPESLPSTSNSTTP